MKYTLNLVLLFCTASLFAQNSIESTVNSDPETLILETFLSSDCFDVSNINITTFGDSTQIGLFYGGGSSIGIDSGIVFSTGNVNDIVGPNDQDNTSTEYPQNPLPDSIRNIMDILTNNSTYEVVIVAFDFVPTVPNIEFEYVFASEEYCEYIGEDFFDTFGFIISGPGINGPFPNGGENIALIPGTNDFVNISNINHQVNSQYYIDNTLTSIPRPCNLIAEPAFEQEIEFDGFTVPLKAVANVIPCETYRLQIIIADVFQRDRDSGVFLGANSFKAGQAVSVSTGTNALGDGFNAPFEGCSEPYFTFSRANMDVTDSVVVYFTVSAQSTATFGLDFAMLPDSIIIPAGEMSYSLPVEVFADNLDEGIEEIILDVVGSCSCETTSINMFIQDPPPLLVDSPDFSTCSGTETMIEPLITNGAFPFSYQWEDGSSEASLTIAPTDTTTYRVTITDLCGEEVVSEIFVMPYTPTASMTGDGYSCNNTTNANIDIALTGFGNWEVVYAFNGQNDTISNILQNNISIPTNTAGTYELISVSADSCPADIDDGVVEIPNTDIQVNTGITNNSCFDANDGTINITASNGTAPYSFQWDNLNNEAITNTNMADHNVSNLSNGTFNLSITDANGCHTTSSFTITEPPVLATSVENVVDVNCSNPSQGSIDLSTQGGTAPYSYEWNNQSDTENLNNLDGGTYLVTVSDHNNCSLSLEVTVAEDLETPMIQLEVDDVIDCATAEIEVSSVGSSSGIQFEYQWTTNDGNIQTPNNIENIIVNQAGNYQLQIINTNNFCESNATIEVTDDFNYPISEAGDAITLNCQETLLPLNASASSSGSSFNYQWFSPENHPIDNVNSLMPNIQEAGTYYLTVTNVENGCTSVDSVEVFEDTALPVIQLNIPETLDCNTLSVSLDANGSSTGNDYNYIWRNPNGDILANNAITLNINSAGEYSLEIINTNNGCATTETVEVQEDYNYPTVEAGNTEAITCSENTVFLDGSASDQGNHLTYNWSGPNDGILNGMDAIQSTVQLPGMYYLQIANLDNGCMATDSVEVVMNLAIESPTLTTDGILTCSNEEVLIAASFLSNDINYELDWFKDQDQIIDQNNNEISVETSGVYTLIATNPENACMDTTFVEIFQDIEAPIIDLGASTTLNCIENTYTFQSQNSSNGPSFSYQWSSVNGSFVSATDILQASIDDAGDYTLSITNIDNGCMSNDQINIAIDTISPSIQMESPDILNCNQSSITIDAFGSSQGNEFEYTWQGPVGSVISGSNTLNPNINSPGQYSLTILNINNWCESNASIEVTIDTTSPVIILQEPDVLTCSQTEVTINSEGSDSGANFEYQWSSNDDFIIENEDSSSPTMVEAGIYELLLQNLENGCSSIVNISIEVDTMAPSLVIHLPDTINCDQLSVELDLYISSSTQNAIQWSTASGNIISGATTDLAIVDAAGTYTVAVSDLLNDCLATAETEVAIDTLAPVAVANVPDILDCNNTSTLIDGGGSSEGEFSYYWTGPDHANIENEQSLMPEVDEAGIYTLLITNTNNFCTTSLNVMVNQDIEEPIVNIMPSEILDCGTTSTTITAEVDQNNYNFNWQAEDGSTIEEGNINSITLDYPGWISLLVTNPDNGCFTESSTIIEQDITIPVIDAGEGTILNCVEPTAILNGTNSSTGNTFSYQWTTSDGQIISFANSLQPLIQGAGLYILEVINTQNECSNQDSVIVLENIPVDAIVDASEILCVDDEAEIQISGIQGGEGPYLYSINHGDSFSNFAYFTNLEAGTYQIIVQDINGCEWQSEIAIEAPNELEVQLDERAFLTLGQDYPLFLQLNIPDEEVASVQWSPAEGLSCTDCLLPIATPLETTIYRVEVLSINGCKDETNIQLFVNRDTKVYIPNAFSPNNDGVNDSFTAYSDPEMIVQIKNMRIYDRWGNTLFERSDFAANDPSLGWDGIFKGSLMNDGVFAYWIEVELIDGTTSTFKGDVAIIK